MSSKNPLFFEFRDAFQSKNEALLQQAVKKLIEETKKQKEILLSRVVQNYHS